MPTVCSARAALERELVGLDRDGLRLDRLLRGVIIGEGGAGRLNDRALGADDLLERLTLMACACRMRAAGRPPWKIGSAR